MVRIHRRLAYREALLDLVRYRATWDLPAFLANRDAQRMVSQALYVAIQAATDEAMAEVKARSVTWNGQYRDAFLALGRAGALDPELASGLAEWASLRNILAHFYPVIDWRRLHAALAEIEPLETFLAWLESESVA